MIKTKYNNTNFEAVKSKLPNHYGIMHLGNILILSLDYKKKLACLEVFDNKLNAIGVHEGSNISDLNINFWGNDLTVKDKALMMWNFTEPNKGGN